jgi:flavin reductase (DIM6/NTAB) family NADH-FMN oxidoreductase RutF
MSVDAPTFKAALSRFASGVTVVTVADAEGPVGMTASAFTSLSLDPPLVLVCVAKKARFHARLLGAAGFGVSLLDASQKALSNAFAGWGPDAAAPWAIAPSQPGAHSGAPLLDGALAVLDCTRVAVHDGGDHSIVVGRVEAATLGAPAAADLHPLLYFAGKYRHLGEALD